MGSPRPSMASQSSYNSMNDREAWQSTRTAARFVLGTDWSLRAFDAKGQPLWQRSAPAIVWAVNISGDGRLVIAAYGDGTIRWHRMDDGRELLALYVLADKQNWVAWTPEGFYGATAGAFGVLQWQVNRGFDAAADTVPVNAIPRLRRPDALAVGASRTGNRSRAGHRRPESRPPGRADRHRIDEGARRPAACADHWRQRLWRQGKEPAAELCCTGTRTTWRVPSSTRKRAVSMPKSSRCFLHDGTADKAGIFEALAAMERNMASGAGQDLAVVMFSGHGTMIDNQFYLVPHGADNSTPARLKASAIPATEFQSEIEKLAQHGRVLVLLDACRSAGLIGGLERAAGRRRAKVGMTASNVTVLTSSTADKVSREDEKWGHGAFTKVLLDALSASDDIDTDHNGVISMSELTAYIEKRLTNLTNGDQQLGLEQRFQGDIFVAGL